MNKISKKEENKQLSLVEYHDQLVDEVRLLNRLDKISYSDIILNKIGQAKKLNDYIIKLNKINKVKE